MARDLESAFRLTEGMTSLEEFRLLHRLAMDVRDGCIVEVGAYRGRSSVALGLGSIDGGRDVPVFSIEPHEEFVGVLGGRFGPDDRAAFYRTMLESGCVRVVRLVNLSSETVAPHWTRPVALLWIDGDHREEAVKRDFHGWLPHLADGAVVAFDDATDPKLGPRILVEALLASGLFRARETVGKVVVLELARR
jgi:predicted O-methyltransferase YrrM